MAKAQKATAAKANPKNVNKIKEAFLKAEAAKEEAAAAKPIKEKKPKTIAITKPEIVIPQSITTHQTVNGPFVVVNHGLVGQKFINLIQYVLSDPKGTFVPVVNDVRQGHGINMIDFRHNNTVGFYNKAGEFVECPWYCWSAARTVGCSITKCVTNAFEATVGENARKEAKYQNIDHLVWQNLLMGFFHELHHAETAIDNYFRLMSDDKFRKEEEAKAEEFAKRSLYELATQVNIEPEISPDMKSLISEVWDSLELENSKDPNVIRFIKCQEYMANTGDSWVALSEDMTKDHHIYGTYREFLMDASGGKADDVAWSAAVPSAEEVLGINAIPVQTPTILTTTQEVYEDEVYVNGPEEMDEEYQNAYGATQNFETAYEQPMTNPPGFQGVQQQPQPQYQEYNGNPAAIAENAPQQQQYQPAYQQHAPEQTYQQAQTQQPTNPNVVVGAGTYEKPNMDAVQFQAVVNGLYSKIYNQIFNVCQFNPSAPNQPVYGALNRIKETIPLTPEENMIVKEMDSIVVGENGIEQLKLDVPVNGWISGRFMDKAGTLPGFVLALTDLNGNRVLRKFLPQNPWKVSEQTGQYTGPATRAQQGHRIAWVLDPNNKGFDRRFYDGTLEFKENNRWTAKEAIISPTNCNTQFEGNQLNSLVQNIG